MAEIEVASPFDLPRVLEGVANDLGGRAFRDKAIAAFVLSRQVKPHVSNRDSYIKFGADHKIPTETDPLAGVSYHVERGDRREVRTFSKEVLDAFAEMEYELPDAPGLWEEEATCVTLALDLGRDDMLFIATHDMRYGLDEDVLLEVPVIGGKPIFVEAENLDPPADMLPTFEADNVVVMELMQIGVVPVRQSFGELDALLADFAQQNRAEELTAEVATMLNALMPK